MSWLIQLFLINYTLMTQIYKGFVSCTFQKVMWCGEKGQRGGFGQNEDPCPDDSLCNEPTARPWTCTQPRFPPVLSLEIVFILQIPPGFLKNKEIIGAAPMCKMKRLVRLWGVPSEKGCVRPRESCSAVHVSGRESLCWGFALMVNWSMDINLSHSWHFLSFSFFLLLNLNKTVFCWQEKKCWASPFLWSTDGQLEPERDFSPWQDHFILFRIYSSALQDRGKKTAFSVFSSRYEIIKGR